MGALPALPRTLASEATDSAESDAVGLEGNSSSSTQGLSYPDAADVCAILLAGSVVVHVAALRSELVSKSCARKPACRVAHRQPR